MTQIVPAGEPSQLSILWPSIATASDTARESDYWERAQAERIASWVKTAADYQRDPMSLHLSFWVLNNHPVCYRMKGHPHERNLVAGEGVKNGLRLTTRVVDLAGLSETAVHYELYGCAWPNTWHRLSGLDGFARSFDAAIIEAAHLLTSRYGYDRRRLCAPQDWLDANPL